MSRGISKSALRSYFQDWLDTNFTYGLIDRNRRQATLDRLHRSLPELITELVPGQRTVKSTKDRRLALSREWGWIPRPVSSRCSSFAGPAFDDRAG